MKSRLTKAFVEAIALPDKGKPPARAWDDKVPGFGVKVTSAGSRIYEFKYRNDGTQRWCQLGRHGEGAGVDKITTEKARNEALRLRGLVASGKDPARERDDVGAAGTIAAAINRYLDASTKGHRRRDLSAEYVAEVRRTLRRDVVPV